MIMIKVRNEKTVEQHGSASNGSASNGSALYGSASNGLF